MDRDVVRLRYSLSIGTAKLIPIDLCLPTIRYQAEQKDNSRIDPGICCQVVSTSELHGLCFLLYSIANKTFDPKKDMSGFYDFFPRCKDKKLYGRKVAIFPPQRISVAKPYLWEIREGKKNLKTFP